MAYKASRQTAFESTARRRSNKNPLLETKPEDEASEMGERAAFHFVRDYETVKIDMDVPNEFLLALDDGQQVGSGSGRGDRLSEGTKGAFYKNIERKYVLKKRKRQIVSLNAYLLGLYTKL